jgi:hypothetical protein
MSHFKRTTIRHSLIHHQAHVNGSARRSVVLMFGWVSGVQVRFFYAAASLLSLHCLNASLCCLQKWLRGWNRSVNMYERHDSINSTRCRSQPRNCGDGPENENTTTIFCCGGEVEISGIEHNVRCTCECRIKERQLKRIFTFVWHLCFV